jgi:hypothetical protein
MAARLVGQRLVERLWHSLKDKEVQLKAYAKVSSPASITSAGRRGPWPHFRGFDLNNIDYQSLAGHSAF